MKIRKLAFLASTFAIVAMPAFATPSATPAATGAAGPDKAAIEQIVRDLLNREPQLIVESVNKWQEAQESKRAEEAGKKINELAGKLTADAKDPVGGNAKGDVTIVEFFDFNCGYCKRVHKTVNELKAKDKNVRYVFKNFPILGESSTLAARAALAAHKQGKYEVMHNALMEANRPDEAAIMALAQKVGLDMDKFKAAYNGDEVKADIAANLELGRQVGVSGTPGFIIDGKLYPGAMELAQFESAVNNARTKKK